MTAFEYTSDRLYLLPPFIVIPDAEGGQFVQVADITRCEADGNYCQFYIVGDEAAIISARPLRHFESLLSMYGFVRIHDSHMVNLNYAVRYDTTGGGKLKMYNDEVLPVANLRRTLLISKMMGYR